MQSITEIIYSHLAYRLRGETDQDITKNFAQDVVVLSSLGRFYGHEGVKESAGILSEQTAGGSFSYRQTLIEDQYAFLEWTASAPQGKICDGADSFVVKDGLIVLQTIHYSHTPAT
ncbi:MAG TPA: nuclear transport factor 2 family protein [Beutenbergiaceae bacterium]|nr:nuclear transport factor 2 family protein [Beutenbergiaceae bacterium]